MLVMPRRVLEIEVAQVLQGDPAKLRAAKAQGEVPVSFVTPGPKRTWLTQNHVLLRGRALALVLRRIKTCLDCRRSFVDRSLGRGARGCPDCRGRRVHRAVQKSRQKMAAARRQEQPKKPVFIVEISTPLADPALTKNWVKV